MARGSLSIRRRRKTCHWCGNKLRGQQQRWCSGPCATNGWYRDHPEIKRQQGLRQRATPEYKAKHRRYQKWYYRKNKVAIKKQQKEYYKRTYPERAKAWRAYSKKRSEEFRNIVREYKNKPCMDCGKRYAYYIMELDHVRGQKLCNPTDLRIRAHSKKKLMKELAKCEPVCANCHRERTQQRKMAGLCK
jgi:hypothetical protein